LSCLPWGEGVFHTGGPSGAGADALAWAAGVLGLADAAAVTECAAGARDDVAPLVFLPALTGTRAPSWNAAARAALIGLDRAHGPAEIARAVLEGVAFADRDLHGGLDCDRVVIAGGGARSDLWCQIRADVMGRPVLRAGEETGLVGAAALAWTGLGAYPDLAAAQVAMCRYDRSFEPKPSPRLERLYDAWRRAWSVADVLAGVG
jgi:xylulokinase